MTAGRPDYNLSTVIKGQSPSGTLVPVALDASGNLVALVTGSDGISLHTVAVDSSGQLIMVPRGQSGNYMSVDANGFLTSVMKGLSGSNLVTLAVDTDGNIISILKGDYTGSLKTLAVDAQGRMLAVLTDPEDVFGNPAYMGAAELAVRLGALSAFERRGQTLYQCDFSDGLGGWEYTANAVGAEVRLATEYKLHGSYSTLLKTGPTTNDYTYLNRRFPYPTLTNYGMEHSTKPLDSYANIETYIYHQSDTTLTRYSVLYDTATSKLQVYDSDGAYHDVATGIVLATDHGPFHYFKLIVDFSTGQYIRLLVDNTSYDLSAYSGYQSASAISPYIEIRINCITSQNLNANLYVDSVVITQNEPA